MNTPTSSRKNIYILAFTLVVVMLGFGLIIPILPFYIQGMGAGGSELGLLIATYAIMRLICGPMWGSLSDRIGRKPVLMIGVLGYGVTMVLFGLATEFWMLFVFRSLSGILSSATSPTTMAYVSDSTSEKERGGGMGLLGAALGLGTILGPGLGGLLAKQSLSTPFFIAGGLSFLALLLIALFLPESLPVEARQRQVAAEAGSQTVKRSGNARRMWQALRGPLGSTLLTLLAMTFLYSYAITTFSGIFGLYADQQYQYGPKEVGWLLMAVGLVSAVAQGGLTGRLIRRWGEMAVIKAGLLGACAGFGAMVAAVSPVAVLASICFFTLSVALLGPTISALVSRRAPLEHGLAMGLNSSAESLGRIFGPAISGFLFDLQAWFPYLCAAVVMLAGFLFFTFYSSHQTQKYHSTG